jgi:enamine deaminase RidA (YjgF/YER057c/UK114 family)
LLAEAGADKTKLLMVNILAQRHCDVRRDERGLEWWVAQGNTPARVTVEAKLVALQYTVEIAPK